MVNVSSDDHVGAVSFQAIAVRDSNDELGRGRGRGSSSSDAVGITPYGSFDADLLSALSIPASPDGLLAARVRAAEQLAREGSIMPECVLLSGACFDEVNLPAVCRLRRQCLTFGAHLFSDVCDFPAPLQMPVASWECSLVQATNDTVVSVLLLLQNTLAASACKAKRLR